MPRIRRLFIFNYLVICLGFIIRPVCAQSVVEEKIKYVGEIRDLLTKTAEEEVKTINLLNNLNLRKAQLEFIISQAKEIETTREQVYSEFEQYAERLLDSELRIKSQVETGRVFPDQELVKEYREVKKDCDALFYRLNNRVKEGIYAVEGKMEDFQLVALDKYVPCILPIIRDSFIGGVDKAAFLVSVLKVARQIPEERFEIEKDQYIAVKIAEIKNKLATCKRLCPGNTARMEIAKAILVVRKMDDVDFKARINELAEELSEKIILEEPEISRQDKIQRFLLSAASIPVLEKMADKR
jgi:hypothetical protein